MALRKRKRPDALTLADLVERWGQPLDTIRNWVYRQKVLRPLPTTRGQRGRGHRLLFSAAEVERFEELYEGVRRAPAAGGAP